MKRAKDLAVTSSHLLLSIAVEYYTRFSQKHLPLSFRVLHFLAQVQVPTQISLISNPWLESFTNIPSRHFLACIFSSTESKPKTDSLKSRYILHHQVTKNKTWFWASPREKSVCKTMSWINKADEWECLALWFRLSFLESLWLRPAKWMRIGSTR